MLRTKSGVLVSRARRTGALGACLLAVAIAVAACSSGGAASTATATTGATGTTGTSRTSGVSAAECAANKAAGTITYISPFGYSPTAGVVDVFMAQDLGYFSDLCLNVSVVTNNAGQQDALVSAGRAQATGFGGAVPVISEVGEGSNFEAVETVADSSETTILTNSKITNLKQLEGQTVGYFGELGSDELSILKAAGVDLSKVKFVSLSNQNPAVITQGQVQAIVANEGNQDLQLTAEHIPFHEYTEAQYGIKGTASVMVFNKSFLAAHSQAVTDFVRADIKALDYCIATPAPCEAYVASQAAAHGAGQIYTRATITAGWNFTVSYLKKYATSPLGAETTTLWNSELSKFQEFGPLASELSGQSKPTIPALSGTYDPSIVNSLYNNGQLVWP